VQVRALNREDRRSTGVFGERPSLRSTWQCRARVVIAADGPGSIAWSALGQRPPRGSALALAITGYYEGVTLGPDTGFSEHYFEKRLPCGYGWIFPPVEGACNVGVYQRADRYHALREPLAQLLDDFVARHPDRFAGAHRNGRLRTWPLPLATLWSPAAAAGLLTCGDAGGLVDPLSGEGIWHALRSGQLAARAAVKALASDRGFDAAAARRYRLSAAREVSWPSALRVLIQRGMEQVVSRGLYRSTAVRTALGWGYGHSIAEVSKSVG
jgi:flavin-dependent dehydrogenase